MVWKTPFSFSMHSSNLGAVLVVSSKANMPPKLSKSRAGVSMSIVQRDCGRYFGDLKKEKNSRLRIRNSAAHDSALPLRRVDVGKSRAGSDLVKPNLAGALGALHAVIVVPTVGVEADVELKGAVVVDGGIEVVHLKHLGAVIP